MTRAVALALCGVLLACGGARHPATRSQGKPFAASSIRSQYGVQGRMEGTIEVADRWVYIVAPVGAVKTYQVDRQDYWDLRMRAGLVSCKRRDIEIVSEGRASRIMPLLGLSPDAAYLDTTTITFKDTLRLDVGIPAGTDLAHSWIALVFEWPVAGALATYELHTNVPLNDAAPWSGRQAAIPAERCR